MSNANGAQGGSDFSAQWIQYYRSMGMHREAEFIEQQAKQMKVYTLLITFISLNMMSKFENHKSILIFIIYK